MPRSSHRGLRCIRILKYSCISDDSHIEGLCDLRVDLIAVDHFIDQFAGTGGLSVDIALCIIGSGIGSVVIDVDLQARSVIEFQRLSDPRRRRVKHNESIVILFVSGNLADDHIRTGYIADKAGSRLLEIDIDDRLRQDLSQI